MDKIIELLKNKEHNVHIEGINVRLFWQDAMEGNVIVTESNKHVVCEGYQVITWKRSKPVMLYFGDSLEDALSVFENNL